MIAPRKLNAVGIVVRDLQRSLAWYKEKFGFEHLFDVSNGVIIGANGVELWVAQAGDPANARQSDHDRDVCIRMIGFEVSEDDDHEAQAQSGLAGREICRALNRHQTARSPCRRDTRRRSPGCSGDGNTNHVLDQDRSIRRLIRHGDIAVSALSILAMLVYCRRAANPKTWDREEISQT